MQLRSTTIAVLTGLSLLSSGSLIHLTTSSKPLLLFGEDKALNDQVALNTTSIPAGVASQKSASAESDNSVHRQNLQKKVDLLRRGLDFMKSVHSYTGTLDKQEVVHGELLEEQSMDMKCRHQPFSVYLRWTAGDVGREVIFVEGVNNNRMIAHDGGWKARIPAFKLTPECALAMRDARYPITKFGITCFIETMLEVHENDLKVGNLSSCSLESNQEFDGRTCNKFTTVYQSSKTSPIYRKSVTFIDSQWNIPLYSEHYEWGQNHASEKGEDLDKSTLIEKYAFRDLNFDEQLSDIHFDRSNKEYNFR